MDFGPTLLTADHILSYRGSRLIAQGIVSFEFADGEHLAVSIETRKEAGKSYSAVQGFFRRYELIYTFADEKDVLRFADELSQDGRARVSALPPRGRSS